VKVAAWTRSALDPRRRAAADGRWAVQPWACAEQPDSHRSQGCVKPERHDEIDYSHAPAGQALVIKSFI
jgi:hypothetical protein